MPMQNEPTVRRLLVWAALWPSWDLTAAKMARVAFSREDVENQHINLEVRDQSAAYVPCTMFPRKMRLSERRARAVWMEIGGTRGLALKRLQPPHHHELTNGQLVGVCVPVLNQLGITVGTKVRFLARGSR
jgi:hypothetical protein